MRSAFSALAVSALLTTTLPTVAVASTPEEIFRDASPSVWVVLANGADNRVLASGSGVVVAAGRVVTNCHVLRGAASITLRQERKEVQAKLEFPDAARDLCQLKADDVPSPAAPIQIAPASALRVGQKVYAIGAPRGLEQSLSDGLVSALRRDSAGEIEFIQMTAPISPGSSGGGLFDEQGRLVGITTAGMSGSAQNLNFARPAEWIGEIPARGAQAIADYKRGKTAPQATTPTAAPASMTVAPRAPTPAAGYQPRPTTPATATGGRDAYNAERLARSTSCAAEPRAALVAKGPGFETYSIACSNGDALAVRCEFGNCRELK
ncbi:S1C family serine protease [Variovorax sp. Sphag1AA]|uniref:S1C family serine protease n=1 Tax=Variovorax sp. Sphag1AA TaxID=2587027 RepID=UPI0016162630|nr:serine protease [Variovorax sp. Sphag1AA]MBB3181815.1 S1-C subfamily serine protease [Variovorax sp. Sphag1AA]